MLPNRILTRYAEGTARDQLRCPTRDRYGIGTASRTSPAFMRGSSSYTDDRAWLGVSASHRPPREPVVSPSLTPPPDKDSCHAVFG